MLRGPPRRRRARPVADAPISALLSRSEDLAKGWLLALLEQAPLDEAPRILAAELSTEGPRLCEAVVRAIGDDRHQRRLEPGGELAPLAARSGELAGAASAEATSRAVDALQAIVWTAVRGELVDPDPDLIAELAERLAQVAEIVRCGALRGGDDPPARPARDMAAQAPQEASQERSTAAGRPQAPPRPRATTSALKDAGRAWLPGEQIGPEPEPLWVRALEEEIERSGGSQLSLVLAELEDADRVRAVDSEPAGTFGAFADAVRGAVRRHDILVGETDARAWIIALQTGRAGAEALGMRISRAVHDGEPWRGAPMVATIGVAVLGDDGSTGPQLIDAAELARFEAAASGVDLIRAAPEQAPVDR